MDQQNERIAFIFHKWSSWLLYQEILFLLLRPNSQFMLGIYILNFVEFGSKFSQRTKKTNQREDKSTLKIAKRNINF